MEVEIVKAFTVDGSKGKPDTRYRVGQIVKDGAQHWIDNGLAVAVKPKTLPTKKSAD